MKSESTRDTFFPTATKLQTPALQHLSPALWKPQAHNNCTCIVQSTTSTFHNGPNPFTVATTAGKQWRVLEHCHHGGETTGSAGTRPTLVSVPGKDLTLGEAEVILQEIEPIGQQIRDILVDALTDQVRQLVRILKHKNQIHNIYIEIYRFWVLYVYSIVFRVYVFC